MNCAFNFNFSLLLLGATTENLPPGVMYRVKASYKYQAEDVDELSFEVGEVINVIEYEDPDDHVSSNATIFYLLSPRLWLSNKTL